MHSQTLAVRSALLLDAAGKGNEQAIFREIADLRALSSPPSPEVLRNLLYACLRLSDFYNEAANEKEKTEFLENGQNAKERSLFWLNQAKEIFDRNQNALPPAELANAHLAADLAERMKDWRAMLNAWNAIVSNNEPDLRALLGMARALQHLGDYASSWQSLRKAETLVKNDADLLALALQQQAVAGALPRGYPQREEKKRQADALARKRLAKGWNNALALNLFFRALETKNLREAEELLQSMESRGLATPREYLGLAEAQVAQGLQHPNNTKGAKNVFETVPPGAPRDSARRNAQKALKSGDPETLRRLLYVFMALNDKQQVLAILKRIEQAQAPETPAALRQLSDAYGFLGDKKRQFDLLEKRARLTGKLADWTDAIDRRYWEGDCQGALQLLNTAESLYPGNAELTGRRILALVDTGHYGQAIKVFQDIRKQEPEIGKKMPAESFAALALAYDKNGLFERARHFFRLSLTKEPANSRAVLGLAALYRREGKTGEAARLLQKFLERHPENLWVRAELANLRPALGKRQYNRILANTPDNAGNGEKAVRALALWQTGRLKEALKIYADLMQNPQKDPSLMCDYAQALMDAGKMGEAENILNKAIQKFPDHLLPRRILAAIFIREKEYARAEACLRKALDIAPRNAEILRQLAFVQQMQKKSWKAQKTWHDAGKR